jgi:protein TonB
MRRFGWILAIFIAILLHAGFILFGGLIFGTDNTKKQSTTQEVELVTDVNTPEKEKDKPKDQKDEKKEEVESETEKPPDAEEMIKNLETPAVNDAPALEAASLSAIEQALNGQAGTGGEFSEGISFASGGRIGGMGKAGGLSEKLENAFSLTEIDQKPKAINQPAPPYPAEMRGKKVEGVVSVIFVVDASGKVTNPKVERSTHAAFDKPALDAVRQWKFEPAIKGGQRVGCRMRVPIRFQQS